MANSLSLDRIATLSLNRIGVHPLHDESGRTVEADYVRAFSLAASVGGLASHAVHDDVMVKYAPGGPLEDDLMKRFFNLWHGTLYHHPLRIPGVPGESRATWARELVAYPAAGSVFRAGADIMDEETGWILPAVHVPREACERPCVGLYIDPSFFLPAGNQLIVQPHSVMTLEQFPQTSGAAGVAEAYSRMPRVDDAANRRRNDPQLRFLHRKDHAAIRPIVRQMHGYNAVYCRDIYANRNPMNKLTVGYVQKEQ